MIRQADIAAGLVSRGIIVPILHGAADIPDMPDRIVVLTPTGGPGTSKELAFDRASVQVLVRGDQGPTTGSSAEELATTVDLALMTWPPPIRIGGRHVTHIAYVGGPPGFIRRDGRRAWYGANYLFEIARD